MLCQPLSTTATLEGTLLHCSLEAWVPLLSKIPHTLCAVFGLWHCEENLRIQKMCLFGARWTLYIKSCITVVLTVGVCAAISPAIARTWETVFLSCWQHLREELVEKWDQMRRRLRRSSPDAAHATFQPVSEGNRNCRPPWQRHVAQMQNWSSCWRTQLGLWQGVSLLFQILQQVRWWPWLSVCGNCG